MADIPAIKPSCNCCRHRGSYRCAVCTMNLDPPEVENYFDLEMRCNTCVNKDIDITEVPCNSCLVIKPIYGKSYNYSLASDKYRPIEFVEKNTMVI